MQSICLIVSHLFVFGSIAYPHVLDQERSKLDNESKNYVFIRYDLSSKGYKLKNLSIGKLIVNRDVKLEHPRRREISFLSITWRGRAFE